jgi:hypothetical protein
VSDRLSFFFKVRPDLSLHKPGDRRALPSRPSEEGFELLANDFVEKRLVGFMAFVSDGGKCNPSAGSGLEGPLI